MRYIEKNNEPQEFSDWKACANDDWKPTYDDLSGKEKRAVYNSLLIEQGHLCCYCERELTGNDYHIEHLNPQFKDEGDDLHYGNFLCSCLNKTVKGAPLHCGKLKDDRIITIHPLQKDCQSKFKYTAFGNIIGMDKESKETIEILGLDIDKLVSMRKEVVSPFLSDDINDEEFKKFIKGYITNNVNDKRNAFCSMIEFLFKDFL